MKSLAKIYKNDSDEYYIKLEEILAGLNINIDDIYYYEFSEKDGNIELKLYNKNKEQICLT